MLSEFILNYSRLDTVTRAHESVSEEKRIAFMDAIERLKQFEPVQYITGSTEFFGMPFHVNKHALIPRPETEELVSWILDDQKAYGDLPDSEVPVRVLDVGTGSGCIAIALASQLPRALVTGLDVSEEVLYLAQSNAALNHVEVQFEHTDILMTSTLKHSYDVIVSNPPYVRASDKELMHANVLEFEPHTALFVSDEDPLLFFKRIGMLAIGHLQPHGRLYFEINEYLGEELVTAMHDLGFSKVELRKDFLGKDRMLRCMM
ncbi:MAG: peptide chain release factor N(5)-glutamine methyltransferase [Bacteroidota bacterium]